MGKKACYFELGGGHLAVPHNASLTPYPSFFKLTWTQNGWFTQNENVIDVVFGTCHIINLKKKIVRAELQDQSKPISPKQKHFSGKLKT